MEKIEYMQPAMAMVGLDAEDVVRTSDLGDNDSMFIAPESLGM